MRFWDASAVIPLVLAQPASPHVSALISVDAGVTVWWITWVECSSAITRLVREGRLDSAELSAAQSSLTSVSTLWSEVQPLNRVRRQAARALAVHPLRAADALQLAAALDWADGESTGRGFVSLDSRLRDAARKEGFTVEPAMWPVAA